jgi:hypothetical protein
MLDSETKALIAGVVLGWLTAACMVGAGMVIGWAL